MNMGISFTLALILFYLIIPVGLVPTSAWADGEDHKGRRYFEKRDRDRVRLFKHDDEGSETVGQIAAWLLLAANFPVALSILIKWVNRFFLVKTRLKNKLIRFNRFQKKYLMRFHFFLNPLILGIALWHWLSSQCRSTSLPEYGLVIMCGLTVLGLVLKFKLCPKRFIKSIYQFHTQPMILIGMVIVLSVGHLIVD